MQKFYHGDIKLDIDHRSIFKSTLVRASILELDLISKTKTRKGYHITFRSKKKLTEHEAVLIQLLLGSDSKREFLNYMRIRKGASLDKWNILFTTKYRRRKK